MEPPRDLPSTDARDEDHTGEPVAKADRRRPAHIRRLVVAATVAVLAGAAGYVGWLRFEQHQTEVAARQALAAAEKCVVTLINFDSEAMDHNINDILDGSTGEFKDLYGKSKDVLRLVLLDHQAAARGHIVESAVKSATTNKVVVLLLVNQAVSNSDGPDPEIDRSRIKMTMEKVDGRWLASKVELR